jgi:hypothetical protein
MDKLTINLSAFRKIFILFFLLVCLVVIGGYLLVLNGYTILESPEDTTELRNIFIIVLIGLALVASWWKRNQKKKLVSTRTFSGKLSYYKQIYLSRLWWNLFSASAATFLFVLTGRFIFLYFALFEVLITALSYPFELVIKSDLGREDIVFIN